MKLGKIIPGIICLVMLMNSTVTADITAPKISNNSVKYSYVSYGHYPQTEIVCSNDKDRVAELKNINQNFGVKYKAVSKKTWNRIKNAKYDSNGDAKVAGVKYRRICKTDATESYAAWQMYPWHDDTTYHYFRYDDIKWRVLQIKNNKALLISEYALDDEKYNDTWSSVMWNIKWGNSTVRSFLNGYAASKNACKIDYRKNNFIDTAFTSKEQKELVGKKIGTKVKDKVFLLSIHDVYNTEAATVMGFSSGDGYDVNRQCKCTTYAFAKGVYNTGTVWWWLQSPDYMSDTSYRVLYGGEIDRDGTNTNDDSGALRPAILISTKTIKKLK